MEIMNAATARKMTDEALEAKFSRVLDMINTRILTTISSGLFECNFKVDSFTLQDKLFDYLTSRGYAIHYSKNEKDILKYGTECRTMNISWEDAIQ